MRPMKSQPEKGQAGKVRLGVLISGGGRTLMNLHKLIGEGKLAAHIAIVIASRPCQGAELASKAGLNVQIADYKKSGGADAYSEKITSLLDGADTELVVMAGFLSLWKIPPNYADRVINIHPALLPDFGGKGMYGHFVHEAVLKAGCKVSGCTVHFVNNEYDCGPIILQRTVPVMEGDTPDSLAGRVFEQELLALPEAISLFAAGHLRIDGPVVRIS